MCVYVLCMYVDMCQKSVFGVTPQELSTFCFETCSLNKTQGLAR